MALALTILLPADGTAQDEQTRRVVITDLSIAPEVQFHTAAEAAAHEADALLSRALTANEATEFRAAAELFERSALFRTPGDRRGVEGFEAAGLAYFNADEPKRASRAWEEAGNRALILGDVYAASENYMRAALAAHEADDRFRVSDMGWKAYYLTESPRLSKAERTKLRRHISVSPVEIDSYPQDRTVLTSMELITLRTVSSVGAAHLGCVAGRDRARCGSLAGATKTSSTPSGAERATMTETIHFGHDRSDLSPEARAILRDKVRIFEAHPSMRITITGYASTPGTGAYNEALGLRRAEAARAYLVSLGVERSRIEIATRGEHDLMVEGPTDIAGAADRRGEFKILVAEVEVSSL